MSHSIQIKIYIVSCLLLYIFRKMDFLYSSSTPKSIKVELFPSKTVYDLQLSVVFMEMYISELLPLYQILTTKKENIQ